MREFYSSNKTLETRRNPGRSVMAGSTNVRYGKQEDSKKLFNEILNIEDKEERNQKIIALVELLEKNSETNGFFKRDEEIKINIGAGSDIGPQIKLDDIELYTLFFELFATLKKHNPEANDNVVYKVAVEQTILRYFGQFNGDSALRTRLIDVEFDFDRIEEENYKPEIPSISKLKGKNCAMCVERASVSHNLWLLGGYESYYIDASSIKLEGYKDEGHAYCIVNYNGTFKLFDCSINVYFRFGEGINPIEDILNGKPLVVEVKDKKYIYANAYNLKNTETFGV